MEGFRSSHEVVRFGGFELDQLAGELRKDGTRIRLQVQPLQILRILLEQPGKIITREELREKIWPSDTFVDFDHGINNAVKRLRETLGDTAERPSFIETLPRRGYRFIAAIEETPSNLRVGAGPLDSIAVLPFETASSDPDMDYLAIGIPGSIIHGLSEIPNLRVISWRSAASESSRQSDPLAIGRELCVRAVLTGRIWQRANKLRLHVDLLDTANGEEIWGDQYDSNLTELFEVQDNISREVSRKLRLKMTGEAEERLAKRYTANIEAYQLYVRARRWLEKRSAEGFRRGVEYLQQAIQRDPEYAPAHAELAQCMCVPCYYGVLDPNVAYPKARASALRALELDPLLAEAHAVLGLILQTYDWNWASGEKGYERAIELNPNYATAHYHYSYFLAELMRFDEAIRKATEALSRDPMSALLNAALAFVLMLARKYENCITQALTTIELDPTMTLSYMVLGMAYEQKGQQAAAIENYKKGIALGGMLSYQKAFIGHLYGQSGKDAKACKILHELEELSSTTYVPSMASAFVYVGLGEYDLAIGALERACENRETNLVFLKTWPHLDRLRDDPRFHNIETSSWAPGVASRENSAMGIDTKPRRAIHFDEFELDDFAGELRRQGTKLRLQDQPLQILQILIQRAGEIVSREELQKKIWPSDTFVDFDHGINNAIKRLREALGDTADTPRFVETLPRRGYRFIGQIEREMPAFRSLAVLPLENLTHDPEQEYFADGLTEALITTLAKIGELRVVSRTSSMLFKGVRKPLREIARELEVDTIVEGTVLRAGDRVRITAQLIDPVKETHLWAESYDRHLRDILDLQSDVARAIAHEIQIKLTPQEQAQLAQARPVDPEAYEAYLKGRYHWIMRTREGHAQACQYFQQAIAKDPTSAPPYAGLADAVSIISLWGLLPPKEGCGKAKGLALKALELDHSLAEAHTSLAWATFHYDYDFATAEKEFERAIELNTRYAVAHHWFGMCLGMMGRYEEGYTELQRAIRLDPHGSYIRFGLAFVHWCGHRYDQAIASCEKALELDPNSAQALGWLGLSYVAKGMFDMAVAVLEKSATISQRAPAPTALLGEAYAADGATDEAQKVLQELTARTHVTAYFVSRVYAALGDTKEAFRWLETSYRENGEWLVLLNVDPRFDSLHGDARFQDLLRRMNFPS